MRRAQWLGERGPHRPFNFRRASRPPGTWERFVQAVPSLRPRLPWPEPGSPPRGGNLRGRGGKGLRRVGGGGPDEEQTSCVRRCARELRLHALPDAPVPPLATAAELSLLPDVKHQFVVHAVPSPYASRSAQPPTEVDGYRGNEAHGVELGRAGQSHVAQRYLLFGHDSRRGARLTSHLSPFRRASARLVIACFLLPLEGWSRLELNKTPRVAAICFSRRPLQESRARPFSSDVCTDDRARQPRRVASGPRREGCILSLREPSQRSTPSGLSRARTPLLRPGAPELWSARRGASSQPTREISRLTAARNHLHGPMGVRCEADHGGRAPCPCPSSRGHYRGGLRAYFVGREDEHAPDGRSTCCCRTSEEKCH